MSARSRYFAREMFRSDLDLGGWSSSRGSSDVDSRSYRRFGMGERGQAVRDRDRRRREPLNLRRSIPREAQTADVPGPQKAAPRVRTLTRAAAGCSSTILAWFSLFWESPGNGFGFIRPPLPPEISHPSLGRTNHGGAAGPYARATSHHTLAGSRVCDLPSRAHGTKKSGNL